eukprot:scaffold55338_cov44-Prasinocladus_malaysianus.AAC.1
MDSRLYQLLMHVDRAMPDRLARNVDDYSERDLGDSIFGQQLSRRQLKDAIHDARGAGGGEHDLAQHFVEAIVGRRGWIALQELSDVHLLDLAVLVVVIKAEVAASIREGKHLEYPVVGVPLGAKARSGVRQLDVVDLRVEALHNGRVHGSDPKVGVAAVPVVVWLDG